MSHLPAINLELYQPESSQSGNVATKTYIAVMSGGAIQNLIDPENPAGASTPYLKAFDHAAEPTKLAPNYRVQNACMLGAGAFSGAVHFVVAHPDAHLVAVELDPRYKETASQVGYDIENTPRLTPIFADGMRYLESCVYLQKHHAPYTKTALEFAPYLTPSTPKGPFDLILLDAFIGTRAQTIFTTPYAISLMKANMRPNARLATNVSVPCDNPEALLSLQRELNTHFTHVEVLPAIDTQLAEQENYVVVASNSPLGFSEAMCV